MSSNEIMCLPPLLRVTAMSTKSVDSSVLDIIEYDDAKRVLKVRFRTGRVYHYFDVPPATWDALLRADSKGSYFNRVIRRRYRALRVRQLPGETGR
jgi:hypothetical protein